MSIPALHNCTNRQEKNRKHQGYGATWCRIYRRPKITNKEQSTNSATYTSAKATEAQRTAATPNLSGAANQEDPTKDTEVDEATRMASTRG